MRSHISLNPYDAGQALLVSAVKAADGFGAPFSQPGKCGAMA